MNLQIGKPFLTRAADGIARRGFTVAELEAMAETGILGPAERVELIEGEIVPTQAKNNPHEILKSDLMIAFSRVCPDHLRLAVETSIRLSSRNLVEPDICLYPRSLKLEDVRGPDLVIAIEIGDTTLDYDRGLKRQLYARYGVPLYCSIDAIRRRTLVVSGPNADGSWATTTELPPDAVLTLDAVPGFAFRLDQAE